MDSAFVVPMDGEGPTFSDGGSTALTITPSSLQTLMVAPGAMTPTVTFSATMDNAPVNVAWGVDRGDLGSIPAGPSSSATFTPSGTAGGLVNVSAGLNGMQLNAQIVVKLVGTQNGVNAAVPSEVLQTATTVAQLTAGGGVGGVGGEGLGAAVSDAATLAALQTPSGNGQAQGLTFLYPYNGTVWPRGMLAPLLMWDWSMKDADAVQIALSTTSGSFSWTGTFGRPAILAQTNGNFVRMPIPQDVWAMATNSAGTIVPPATMPDQLTVSLTVAKGGMAYGPIQETWPVAPGLLSGIIYYQSYGTQLVKNYSGAVGGDGTFGAAVLSIHVGDTAPTVAAGSNGGAAQCRTCHSVAALGSRLVVQHGDDYSASSAYDLTPMGNTEHVLATGADPPSGSGSLGGFPGVYPDGSMALSSAGKILPLPDDSTLPTVTGLSTVTTDLGSPAFSPSGTQVAFNPMTGPGVMTPTQQLLVMNFSAATTTFSTPVVVVDDTGKPAQTRPGWPAFFPDGNSVVFHHQSVAGSDGNSSGTMFTRDGCKAQIAWTNVTDSQHVTPLNQLNGLDASGNSYLPKLATPLSLSCMDGSNNVGSINPDHGDDTNVNYEPTVNPLPSGGYVWVVFTSRRMYGNEAVIPPFCSDPRAVNLVTNVTPKKLWVAAVDLAGGGENGGSTGMPGMDASHPAFYLPAQELLAGNSRGFWVLDPCKQDGSSCQSGDECCNGYCDSMGDGGSLICAPPTASCSGVNDKCTTSSNCCDPTNLCINGFCTQGAN